MDTQFSFSNPSSLSTPSLSLPSEPSLPVSQPSVFQPVGSGSGFSALPPSSPSRNPGKKWALIVGGLLTLVFAVFGGAAIFLMRSTSTTDSRSQASTSNAIEFSVQKSTQEGTIETYFLKLSADPQVGTVTESEFTLLVPLSEVSPAPSSAYQKLLNFDFVPKAQAQSIASSSAAGSIACQRLCTGCGNTYVPCDVPCAQACPQPMLPSPIATSSPTPTPGTAAPVPLYMDQRVVISYSPLYVSQVSSSSAVLVNQNGKEYVELKSRLRLKSQTPLNDASILSIVYRTPRQSTEYPTLVAQKVRGTIPGTGMVEVDLPSRIALAVVPTMAPSPVATPLACKTGLNSILVREECDATGTSFRYANVGCHDGTNYTLGGPTSCKSSAIWNQYAQEQCAGRSSCSTNQSPIPYPGLPTSVPKATPLPTGILKPSPLPITYPVPTVQPYPTPAPVIPSPVATAVPKPVPTPVPVRVSFTDQELLAFVDQISFKTELKKLTEKYYEESLITAARNRYSSLSRGGRWMSYAAGLASLNTQQKAQLRAEAEKRATAELNAKKLEELRRFFAEDVRKNKADVVVKNWLKDGPKRKGYSVPARGAIK